ncbi:hypothetical protein AOC36_11495 [Erysipelothrix larvae]|uniref:HTH araC/xylS-type domain-containing protein n=1 Tax=Erysipelothrix larvae TaxID=1514105 RepID=A0A109UHQ7_9FIRM|nr:helix-turn-helix domain-containing protein [Erysipelothrix larvae]AMC94573.1 hypothetical protein AOC36_11495 [Erysipelothrix larvae]
MNDLINTIKHALDTIEANLNESIDLNAIASNAGYSLYHFHRIFRYCVGDSLRDYIRKRIMTEAARDLISNSSPIIDIAIHYGYSSREAFSRAFEKLYGESPSMMRKNQNFYELRAPLSLENVINRYLIHADGLFPTIEFIPALTVEGSPVHIETKSYQVIPKLWSEYLKTNHEPMCNAVGVCMLSETHDFTYIIGNLEIMDPNKPGLHLEASYYAVFKVVNPIVENVQKTWDAIYSVWLQETHYKRRFQYDLEYYCFNGKNSYAELWIPIENEGLDIEKTQV